MAKQDERTTTLPGILPTIAAGFEVVTAHLWLVLIPILLDIFYWIGPQLNSQNLILDMAALLRQEERTVGWANALVEVAPRTNLFAVLAVPYLGIPGLMAGLVGPEKTPISPFEWHVDHASLWLFLCVVLIAAGLLIAAVYYSLVAWTVRTTDGIVSSLKQYLRRLPVYCARLFGLAVALLMLILIIYVPFAFFRRIISLLSFDIAELVTLVGLSLVLWLLFYLSFSVYGIMLRERPVLWALLDSVRLVRQHRLSALFLFLFILFVRNTLLWIWRLLDTGSWLTLVSIAGYAFINTSLIAATFIFYRDRYNDFVRKQTHVT